MTKEELQSWLNEYGLNAAKGAKVLDIQKSKMSEYLSGKRNVPGYISAHIDTFKQLAPSKAEKIIEKRL